MSAAAFITGHPARETAHPIDHGAAVRAGVGILPGKAAGFEVEGVTAVLPGNTEVVTGLLPLDPVRLDAPAPGPRKSNEMGEFVEEGAAQFQLALVVGEILEARIEFDTKVFHEGSTCRGPHAGIPAYAHGVGESGKAFFPGEIGGDKGEGRIRSAARMEVRT